MKLDRLKIKKLMFFLKQFLKKMLIVLSGKSRLNRAIQLAKKTDIESALQYINRRTFFWGSKTKKFGVYFFQYLLSMQSDVLDDNDDSCDLLLYFSCWGEAYTKKALDFLLPSLNTVGNLQHLSDSKKIVLLIHGDMIAQKMIMNSAIGKIVSKNVQLKFLLIPQALLNAYQSSLLNTVFGSLTKLMYLHADNKYIFFGGLQYAAFIRFYQRCAYFSFLMPDFVFSEDFFQKIFIDIYHKKVMLASAFRCVDSGMAQDLSSFYKQNKTVLSLSGAQLAYLQITHIHPAAKGRIVSKKTKNFVPSAQLIFEDQNGYIMRCFHYHPILIDCKKIEKVVSNDFSPIDSSLLQQIIDHQYDYDSQIAFLRDAEEACFAELSDSNVEFMCRKNTFLPSYHQFLSCLEQAASRFPSIYYTDLGLFLSQYRYRITNHDVIHEATIDDIYFMRNLEHIIRYRQQSLF